MAATRGARGDADGDDRDVGSIAFPPVDWKAKVSFVPIGNRAAGACGPC
jgi:hypothetical protein